MILSYSRIEQMNQNVQIRNYFSYVPSENKFYAIDCVGLKKTGKKLLKYNRTIRKIDGLLAGKLFLAQIYYAGAPKFYKPAGNSRYLPVHPKNPGSKPGATQAGNFNHSNLILRKLKINPRRIDLAEKYYVYP